MATFATQGAQKSRSEVSAGGLRIAEGAQKYGFKQVPPPCLGPPLLTHQIGPHDLTHGVLFNFAPLSRGHIEVRVATRGRYDRSYRHAYLYLAAQAELSPDLALLSEPVRAFVHKAPGKAML